MSSTSTVNSRVLFTWTRVFQNPASPPRRGFCLRVWQSGSLVCSPRGSFAFLGCTCRSIGSCGLPGPGHDGHGRLFRIIALVNHTLECLKRSWPAPSYAFGPGFLRGSFIHWHLQLVDTACEALELTLGIATAAWLVRCHCLYLARLFLASYGKMSSGALRFV